MSVMTDQTLPGGVSRADPRTTLQRAEGLATAGLTVVGSINVDLIATADRLPGPGETVGGAILSRQPGGKGANQAVAAARLAGRARMIGAVGDDADGVSAVSHLAKVGVDVSGIKKVPEPTGTALIVVDQAGENQIAVCGGANEFVSLDGVTFDEREVVLCQLEIDVAVVLEVSRRARGFFALNTAPAMSLPAELIDRCDLIIANETEYRLIPDLANAKLVAVTYGANGSAIYRRSVRVAQAPGQRSSVVSTVGAGDAFCAALVLAVAGGVEDEAALQVANAVGAAAVRDPSSQPALSRLEKYQAKP
jgi:ribokinase